MQNSVDCKMLEIARHEAGHAVMALICGRKIQVISLREKDSPRGTGKYRAFTQLEPLDSERKVTGKEAVRNVMIALGGYASEILFSNGSIRIGCDDLTRAVEWAEKLLLDDGFRSWTAALPVPEPGALDIIEGPEIRSYIDLKMGDCVRELAPYRKAIQLIAEELNRREELTGDEVVALFNSFKG